MVFIKLSTYACVTLSPLTMYLGTVNKPPVIEIGAVDNPAIPSKNISFLSISCPAATLPNASPPEPNPPSIAIAPVTPPIFFACMFFTPFVAFANFPVPPFNPILPTVPTKALLIPNDKASTAAIVIPLDNALFFTLFIVV